MQKNMNIDGRFEVMEQNALMDVQGGGSEGFIISVRNAIAELFNLNKKDENE